MHNALLERLKERIKNEDVGLYQSFLIPDEMSKKIRTYTLMKSDLHYVRNAAQELIDNEYADLITISIWNSLLITYGKCFTDASKSKSSKLEPEKCFDSEQEKLKKTHDYLMNLRHNFVAHRGLTTYEESLSYLTIGVTKLEMGIGVKTVKKAMADQETLKEIILVVEHLNAFIESKYKVASTRLLEGIQKMYSAEQMQQFRIV